MRTETLAIASSALLLSVALVHFLMAFGVKRGQLVWGGHLRVLTPPLRRRSLLYAILILLSAWTLAAFGGVIDVAPVPDHWLRSAGWTVTVFLGMAAIYSIWKGSTWERRLFGPITAFGAILAGWLTFG